MLADEKIVIHPRCKTLIRQLKNATWDKKRKEFNRTKIDGHFDTISALYYLVRNVVMTKNPYPAGYGMGGAATTFQRDNIQTNTEHQQMWVNLFKSRSSLKNNTISYLTNISIYGIR